MDVADPDPGHLADAGRRACHKDHDVARADELVCRTGDQCISKFYERGPAQHGKGARVIEFILSPLVLALPSADPSAVAVDDPVAQRLLHHAHENRQAVLHRRRLQPSPIQPCTARSTAPLVIMRAECRHDPFAPARKVRVEGRRERLAASMTAVLTATSTTNQPTGPQFAHPPSPDPPRSPSAAHTYTC